MSLEALGAYSNLFCAIWDMPEPGIVRDDDRLLAAMSRVSAEEWARVRAQVLLAFDSETRPGYLIQRGLVRTYEEHFRSRNGWAKRKRASRLRGRDVTAPPVRDVTAQGGVTSPLGVGVVVGVGVGVEESTKTLLEADASESVVADKKPDIPAGFEQFWADYRCVRRTKKPQALAEWKRQGCERDVIAVLAGLARYRQSRQWRDGFMPEPARWIKGRCWEDPELEQAPRALPTPGYLIESDAD